MMKKRVTIVFLVFGFCLPINLIADEANLKDLPLGDGKLSSYPKQGWIWPCHTDPGRGGAFQSGDWIKNDGTYDETEKPHVQGSVPWNFHFSLIRNGDKRVVTTNDLPDHGTGVFPISQSDPAYRYDRNPNRIQEQNMHLELPLNPVLSDTPSCAPGAIGILLSGSVLFNALDAPGRDAVAHEIQDACQGHPQVSGVYHYHSVSSCVPDHVDSSGHSQLVGYALDGFGIYGHQGLGGKQLTSADLDECHGHTHEIIWDDKKITMYHYHATWDFPYTIGCMRGAYSMKDVMTISGPMQRNRNQRRPGGWGPPPSWGPPPQ